ncbi:retrotransposon-related protein, partial [Tanacetum coccineum]
MDTRQGSTRNCIGGYVKRLFNANRQVHVAFFYWWIRNTRKHSHDPAKGLPNSQGKTVIFVVVDRLSKYAHFMALHHPFTASIVAQVFMDNVFKLHELPHYIISERDKVFLSNFWKSLFKVLKVDLHMSTAYHPQPDGQTKVVNRCLECYLRCMTGDKPKEWMQWLSLAEYWYNTNFHSSTNITPFEAVYGQPPPTYVPYESGDSPVESVDRSLQAREQTIQQLKFHLQRSQDRMRNLANKHRTDRQFEVGMWVYVKLQPQRQVTLRKSAYNKLSSKYYGPFQKCTHPVEASGVLLVVDSEGLLLKTPTAILDRRLGKKAALPFEVPTTDEDVGSSKRGVLLRSHIGQ